MSIIPKYQFGGFADLFSGGTGNELLSNISQALQPFRNEPALNSIFGQSDRLFQGFKNQMSQSKLDNGKLDNGKVDQMRPMFDIMSILGANMFGPGMFEGGGRVSKKKSRRNIKRFRDSLDKVIVSPEAEKMKEIAKQQFNERYGESESDPSQIIPGMGERPSVFKKGGRAKKNVKKYQKGKSIPTTQDSLDIFNNLRQLKNFIDTNDYQEFPLHGDHSLEDMMSYYLNGNKTDYSNFREGDLLRYLDEKNRQFNLTGDFIIPRPAPDPDYPGASFYDNIHVSDYDFGQGEGIIPKNFYRDRVDDSKFYQREIADRVLNPDTPKALYDRRIYPTDVRYFENNMGDSIVMPTYDPLLVKPINMLTPKERNLRYKREGELGMTRTVRPVNRKVKNIDSISTLKSGKLDIPERQVKGSPKPKHHISYSGHTNIPNVKVVYLHEDGPRSPGRPFAYENAAGERLPYDRRGFGYANPEGTTLKKWQMRKPEKYQGGRLNNNYQQGGGIIPTEPYTGPLVEGGLGALGYEGNPLAILKSIRGLGRSLKSASKFVRNKFLRRARKETGVKWGSPEQYLDHLENTMAHGNVNVADSPGNVSDLSEKIILDELNATFESPRSAEELKEFVNLKDLSRRKGKINPIGGFGKINKITWPDGKTTFGLGSPPEDFKLHKVPYMVNPRLNQKGGAIGMQTGGIPVSSQGQYEYPGQPVIVPSPNGQLTMNGVDQPLMVMNEFGQGSILPANSGIHQLLGSMFLEIPLPKKKKKKKKKNKNLGTIVSSMPRRTRNKRFLSSTGKTNMPAFNERNRRNTFRNKAGNVGLPFVK